MNQPTNDSQNPAPTSGPNPGPNDAYRPLTLEPASASAGRTIGLLLVALGTLALLGNLGVFGGRSLLAALLFAGLGAYLLRHAQRGEGRLWAFIGAFGLLGLALASLSGPLAGSYFLAMLGAGFALVYRRNRARWWALIPAGTLFSLAAVSGLEILFPRAADGPLFLLGLAATFGLVYLHHRRWAVYPAVALAVLALASASFVSSWLFPLALLGGGLYLLCREPRGAAPHAGADERGLDERGLDEISSSETLEKSRA